MELSKEDGRSGASLVEKNSTTNIGFYSSRADNDHGKTQLEAASIVP